MMIGNPRQAALPTTKGAYGLIIGLDCPLTLGRPAAGPFTLPPGHYLYCGSAYGLGGLAARLRRHLRREKPLRWHVDQVTAVGKTMAVILSPGGCECNLLRRAQKLRGVTIPIPGFGSSDCRNCPAHLARLPTQMDFSCVADTLTAANKKSAGHEARRIERVIKSPLT